MASIAKIISTKIPTYNPKAKINEISDLEVKAIMIPPLYFLTL